MSGSRPPLPPRPVPRRVGLLLKPGKPEAVEIARELIEFLGARGIEVLVAHGPPEGLAGAQLVPDQRLTEAELLVVLGGDGTLLHGAEAVADADVPVLGVNLGNLGFLTSCPSAEACAAVELALSGRLVLERRLRLRVVLTRADGRELVRFACNDAVVSQGSIARLIEFDAFLDGDAISSYRADGLIVATPTGSTAYNLAAGGPILTPELDAMVLSPICPHTLTNRPLVVPASSRLSIQVSGEAQHVMLTIDGQWAMPIEHRDRVDVHAANKPLLLYRRADTTYFEILQAKLHWGERVGAASAPAPGPAAASTAAATAGREIAGPAVASPAAAPALDEAGDGGSGGRSRAATSPRRAR